MKDPDRPARRPEANLERQSRSAALLHLAGDWLSGAGHPQAVAIAEQIPAGCKVELRDAGLGEWDLTLPAFLHRFDALCRSRDIAVDGTGLPAGLNRLLQLAATGGRDQGAAPARDRAPGWLEELGRGSLGRVAWALEFLEFLGELVGAVGRLLTLRARVRGGDVGHFIQQCGAAALPIVSLISVLVGLILAFVGAVQLEMFGAQLYVANLVGIAMARDMGAMMTGVIMAGRTGAAYAASLGAMEVNEEIDALRTLGIAPMEFLVLPRVLALVAMMPLLCCYADLMGILGGGLVCVGLFDITPMQYYQQTRAAVPLHHFAGGLIKATVYGLVVAAAGCHRGLSCGRSAAAVGRATTEAVVTSIVWIVVWCAILTVVYNAIGF